MSTRVGNQPSFLGLPVEIRFLIYSYLLVHEGTDKIAIIHGESLQCCRMGHSLSILGVSKQVSNEALTVLYGQAKFEFHLGWAFMARRVSFRVPMTNWSRVRKLMLTVPAACSKYYSDDFFPTPRLPLSITESLTTLYLKSIPSPICNEYEPSDFCSGLHVVNAYAKGFVAVDEDFFCFLGQHLSDRVTVEIESGPAFVHQVKGYFTKCFLKVHPVNPKVTSKKM